MTANPATAARTTPRRGFGVARLLLRAVAAVAGVVRRALKGSASAAARPRAWKPRHDPPARLAARQSIFPRPTAAEWQRIIAAAYDCVMSFRPRRTFRQAQRLFWLETTAELPTPWHVICPPPPPEE